MHLELFMEVIEELIGGKFHVELDLGSRRVDIYPCGEDEILISMTIDFMKCSDDEDGYTKVMETLFAETLQGMADMRERVKYLREQGRKDDITNSKMSPSEKVHYYADSLDFSTEGEPCT